MAAQGKSYRLGLLCVAVLSVWTPAAAGENPTTTDMDCTAIRTLVRTNGAAVLFTGSHLYDRYVDHAGFCPLMMRTEAAWVPARDNPQCFIGYTCEQSSFRARR